MIKSPAEIALLERANGITLRAIDAAIRTLRPGMSQHELAANVSAATAALGGDDDGALVAFGKESAFPHGSSKRQALREGDVVLVDAGCRLQGYVSDVTRTTVYGTPSQRQRDVWDVEKRAQRAAFEAAQPGATCESVDSAARRVITEAGFGPGCVVPHMSVLRLQFTLIALLGDYPRLQTLLTLSIPPYKPTLARLRYR